MRPRLFIVLLLTMAAAAGAQGIRVTIDRNEATIQDQLVLQVTVEGSQNAVPRLPDLSPFQLRSAGQSSQFSRAGGRTTLAITYNYALLPKQTGTFTVGAATVEIDGRTYSSRPFQVRILEASAEPRESQDIFVTARVSNESPYVGEQVIYTWRLYRRVQIADAQLQPIEFEGFLVEDLGEVREYQTTSGGREFLVSELRKALFPQEEGALTLPPTTLQCQVLVQRRGRSLFDDFFGRGAAEARVLRTPAIEVNVRPRPAAPAGYSGLVGEFAVRGEISKRQLQVGESATWRLTVSGSGNVQSIAEPPLPPLDAFKVYDDKPASSIDRAGGELEGSRTFTKALVPLAAGELTVPAVRLTYFNAKTGSYRTAATAPITLAVSPSDDEEELRLTESVAPTTGKVAVRMLADDILPLYKDLDAVAAPPFGHRAGAPWLAALLAPPLLYLGLVFVERRRRHLEVNVGLVRRRAALKRALGALGKIDGAAAASRVLREYVGDKAGLEGSALTPAEAAVELRRRGVGEETVRRVRERLEALEAAQYGGGLAAAGTEALAGDLKALLKELEREIRA